MPVKRGSPVARAVAPRECASLTPPLPRPPPVIAIPELFVRGVRPVLADDPALVDDEDPVGEREDLLQLERDEEHGLPLVPLADEALVHELDRADVEPPRRLSRDEGVRVAPDLAGDHDLLLVSARERVGVRLRAAAAHVELLRAALRARPTSRRGKSQPNLDSGAFR